MLFDHTLFVDEQLKNQKVNLSSKLSRVVARQFRATHLGIAPSAKDLNRGLRLFTGLRELCTAVKQPQTYIFAHFRAQIKQERLTCYDFVDSRKNNATIYP